MPIKVVYCVFFVWKPFFNKRRVTEKTIGNIEHVTTCYLGKPVSYSLVQSTKLTTESIKKCYAILSQLHNLLYSKEAKPWLRLALISTY